MLKKNKSYKILSIDGGGIRGLIPGLILVEIEKRTGKAISELFDLMAGTSTGGILALGLSVPDKDTGKAAYSAEQVVKLYQQKGQLIFRRDSWRRFKSVLGIFDERYSSIGIEKVLDDYFGDIELKSALTEVLITSYDFEQTRKPLFFKSGRAKIDPKRNFQMKYVARATSAAPTYFEPIKLNPTETRTYYSLVDGAIFANNPAMCAFAEAMKFHPHDDILMVSLGTGTKTERIAYKDAINWGLIEWIRPIIHLMMNGNSDTVDYQLREIFSTREGSGYYRFQVELPNTPEIQKLDNVKRKNLQQLEKLTHDLIIKETKKLDEICEKLVS